MLDHQPPQPLTDTLVERILVVKLLDDPHAIQRIGDLDANAMTDPAMAAVLQAAINLAADGRPINIVSLKPALTAIKLGFERTAFDALQADRVMKMPKGTVASESYPIEEIVARLQFLQRRRQLAEMLAAAASAAWDESMPMTPVAADVIGQCNEFLAGASNGRSTTFSLYEGAERFLERLECGANEIEIPTGLADLDKATGGWHRRQVAILAGRPSMGKSAVALSSMLRTAEKGFGVYFVSSEMSEGQVIARSMTDYAYTKPAIPYFNLRPGNVSEPELRRLRQAAQRFRQMPIIVDTQSGLTVGEILSRARRVKEDFAKRGTPLALIVVDHLLKVRPSDRYAGQPVKELDEISEGMCSMAKVLDVAVLALHQLNRGVESRDNQRPLMSDLRGSGSLEQDADTILFVYRPAYRFERQLEDPDKRAEAEISANTFKHDLEIQIAKQRNGPTLALEFFCDMAANVVRDRSWMH